MERRQVLFGLAAAGAVRAVPLPDASLALKQPEKYWARIRQEQFLLPGWRAFLNNGSLGVTPRPVLAAVTGYMEKSAALDMADYDYPRWGYELLESHRKDAADYLGCRMEDLALVHNATEALSTIAAGIDLKAGDEVVMTDQEHPSGKAGWAVRSARHGVVVREVPITLPPKDRGELVDRMVSAIGPRTRVLFFSGILSPTGLVMPVREICDAARAKGVITVVDGAHMNGQISMRIDELGCDYYAGSPHKWMFAPAGSGILWGREEMLERLWPSMVTGGWDKKEDKAARFMKMGTNNRAIFEGLVAGVRFARAVGVERIYGRVHELSRMVRKKAAELEYVKVLTPEDDRMYGGLVGLEFEKEHFGRLFGLCQKRRIWILRGPRLRLSTHIHTRPQDVDLFFEAVVESRRG